MFDHATQAASAAFYAQLFEGTPLAKMMTHEARKAALRSTTSTQGLLKPVDIFAKIPVPAFPRHVLPETWQTQADDFANSTGFDGGAFLFLKMCYAGCISNHRARLKITDTWTAPPFHWAAIVDASGGGKSPTIGAASTDAMRIYGDLVDQSRRDYAEWRKNGDQDAPFTFRQRHADDTTTEALSGILCNNEDGVTVTLDELTGWLGRMDAYTGGKAGQSKDRPAWLDAWTGVRNKPINRAGKPLPVIVPHWQVAVIGGIQPHMLAQQFKRNQSGGDGLVQRFMLYQMASPGDPDLFHVANPMAAASVGASFDRLFQMAEEDNPKTYSLSHDALRLMQDYVQNMRTIAARTPKGRFQEHINKFPAFLARVAVTLHLIHAAARPDMPDEAQLSADTMQHAIDVMAVLYRHSEAVYAVLDDASDTCRALMTSAAEAILSRGWTTIQRSDLTRYATGWRDAAQPEAEAALDLLIEYAWLADATVQPRNRRGRRSDGKWKVNPSVHTTFAAQSERITQARKERFAAVQAAAAQRRKAEGD